MTPSDYAKRRREEARVAEQYRKAGEAIAREFQREIEIERRARQDRKET